MHKGTQRSLQRSAAMDVNNKSSYFDMKLDKLFKFILLSGLFLSTLAGKSRNYNLFQFYLDNLIEFEAEILKHPVIRTRY